ncbi:MAG: response regulator [Deltaproteobacteria bacterium]|jgi:putative two-component system response regulator|nr:response regulator [Deltaproteobacteria bacterium]
MQHILIVDDNLTNLEQVNIQLEDDFEVSLAKSGPQALEICLATRPDLVLLDIEMPDMDGFETLAALKANPELKDIPVIFLTASPDIQTEIRATKAGASDFIAKPVERDLLLHSINTQLSISRSKDQTERLVRDFEDKLIMSLAKLCEHRTDADPFAAKRVSKLVYILGSAIMEEGLYYEELTPLTLDLMVRAAPLHDIGKIAIPDALLFKPSGLNDSEFALVKTHTSMGEKILKDIFKTIPGQDFHSYALIMTRSHHERFDGKGYPEGLKDSEIPLAAKIMAICDVYDALLEKRPYRAPLSAKDAISVIKSGAGSLFDPKLTELFAEKEDKIVEAARESC